MPKRILIADDVSLEPGQEKRSRSVRAYGAALAEKLGAEADLIHVEDLTLYPVDRPYYKSFIDQYMTNQKSRLARAAKMGGASMRTLFLAGEPAATILRTAQQAGRYEAVILGTHGRRGVGRVILGSIAEEIIRNARVPVMTVGPQAQASAPRISGKPRIMLASDLGRNSRKAEAYAMDLAKRLGAEVVVVHALFEGFHPVVRTALASPSGARRLGDLLEKSRCDAVVRLKAKQKTFESKGVKCSYRLEEKAIDAGDALMREARAISPSLIVMGTHGRNLLAGAFFGTTARQAILEANAPVITVRSR